MKPLSEPQTFLHSATSPNPGIGAAIQVATHHLAIRMVTIIGVSAFVVALLITSTPSVARDFAVAQKNLKFSASIKVIHPGDRIIFSNQDSVTHNVISLTNGFQFDLGAFSPGMKKTLSFDDQGVVDIECTVHPNMKMTLFIF